MTPIAAAMYKDDFATQAMGITFDTLGEGTATLSMIVRKDMLNGHGMAHGGFMFALCDTAFAYACNSRGVATVAAGCSIEYLAPAFEGDTLIAVAKEQYQQGRQGIYDVVLSHMSAAAEPESTPQVIALFRGKSAQIRNHK